MTDYKKEYNRVMGNLQSLYKILEACEENSSENASALDFTRREEIAKYHGREDAYKQAKEYVKRIMNGMY